jgi:4-aminobutyrate aminotransferase-like enzyme
MSKSLVERRRERLGPDFSTFYNDPVEIVRGEGVWLWDKSGRKYLDCYNNVAHVGHCHPHVVEAIARQAGTLNTHTRYLHEGIVDYADRLTATLDPSLSSMMFTCSGSEANDLAIRMAEAVTGKRGIIATDHTYHGNTALVSQLSQTNRPTTGDSDFVRFVPAPDSYRPLGGEAGVQHAHAFAQKVAEAIADLEESGHGFGGILLCPYFANEGFPDLDRYWLNETVAMVRSAGGIVIADEVQPGFGRLGSHMWGHQYQGFVPDVMTIGKPMGNGHPVAGLVTTDAIITDFRKTFRYFNTFGGNPVSMAAAHAMLDVLEKENLMSNAATVGAYAKDGLKRLSHKYEIIGDVRGRGLFFGTELVLDRSTKEPATDLAIDVVEGMKERGVLMNKLGVHYNTTKMRPPMPFGIVHADLMLEAFEDVLRSLEQRR